MPAHDRPGPERLPLRDTGPDSAAVLRTPPHADDEDAIADLWGLLLPPPPPADKQLLAFLPCEHGRPLSKVLCVVDDVPVDPSAADMRQMAAFFAHVVRHHPGGGLLVAIGRRGERTVTERDTRWVAPCMAACTEHDVDLLGVWLHVSGRAAVRLDAPRPGGGDLSRV